MEPAPEDPMDMSPIENSTIEPDQSASTARGVTTTQPTKPLFETRQSNNKGLGLFATQDIPSNTFILSETPLLRLTSRPDSIDRPADLAQALAVIGPHRRRQVLGLYYHRDDLLKNFDDEVLDDLPVTADDFARAHAIVRSNMVRLAIGREDGGAVFLQFSRINHSCEPNVEHRWDERAGEQTVRALRDIKKGEELLTNYLKGEHMSKETRAKALWANWHFVCLCQDCRPQWLPFALDGSSDDWHEELLAKARSEDAGASEDAPVVISIDDGATLSEPADDEYTPAGADEQQLSADSTHGGTVTPPANDTRTEVAEVVRTATKHIKHETGRLETEHKDVDSPESNPSATSGISTTPIDPLENTRLQGMGKRIRNGIKKEKKKAAKEAAKEAVKRSN